MTAIAIWCNHEVQQSPGLWVAGDSRISASPESVLIDDGSKLFALPVICRSPGPDGFFSHVSYAHSFGYCFAGSTLMAQNTYLALIPLLGNLVATANYVPSLADVAKFMFAYLSRTFDEYKARVGEKAVFEVALFGFCHSTGSLSAFHFKPKIDGGTCTLACNEHLNMRDRDFLYLGDARDRVTKRLTSAFSGQSVPGRPLSRIPRHVIQDCIDDESFPRIGGELQIGIADALGFRPLALCKPRILGQPAAYISYLGRELTEDLAWVGQAKVGLPALA